MHAPPARRLPLPYWQTINPLQGLVRAEDQARNEPADMFKPFRTTKDLSKAFHPLGQDLRHPNNRQHGSTLSFSILLPLFSSIHPFFPITFQVVCSIAGRKSFSRGCGSLCEGGLGAGQVLDEADNGARGAVGAQERGASRGHGSLCQIPLIVGCQNPWHPTQNGRPKFRFPLNQHIRNSRSHYKVPLSRKELSSFHFQRWIY